jgi:predicted dehydrogenase
MAIAINMLGAGFIGQVHSLAFGSLQPARQEPQVAVRLKTLVETNRPLAEEVRKRYGWESVAADWRGIVGDPEAQLFINSGPNDVHAEPSIAAAAAGKHVFCEKPLARTAEEAYAIWRGAARAGVKHMCAYVHRFIPALQQARRMIAEGAIGRVRHYRGSLIMDMQHPGGLSWRYSTKAAGGGATGDLGSHHIDQARFLVGEVRRVQAMTKTWTRDPEGKVGDVNDDWFAAAELETGSTALFECTRVAEGHALSGRIEIDGTGGTLRWEMERVSELWLTEPRRGPRRIMVVAPDHPYSGFWFPVGIQGAFAVGWRDAFFHQAHHMLKVLAEDGPVGPVGATFEDGYKVAEIVDAIIRSGRSGRAEDVTFRPAP